MLQNQQSADIGAEENVCRLYSIGKLKDVEDDQVFLYTAFNSYKTRFSRP